MGRVLPRSPVLLSLQVGEGGGFVWHWPWCAGRVFAGRRVEPVVGAGTGDVPVVVVQEQVVVSAEQDAVGG